MNTDKIIKEQIDSWRDNGDINLSPKHPQKSIEDCIRHICAAVISSVVRTPNVTTINRALDEEIFNSQRSDFRLVKMYVRGNRVTTDNEQFISNIKVICRRCLRKLTDNLMLNTLPRSEQNQIRKKEMTKAGS